jgi:hypothetical protein
MKTFFENLQYIINQQKRVDVWYACTKTKENYKQQTVLFTMLMADLNRMLERAVSNERDGKPQRNEEEFFNRMTTALEVDLDALPPDNSDPEFEDACEVRRELEEMQELRRWSY